jgi:hypothetical protein
MAYADRLAKHLAAYKNSRLGVKEKGVGANGLMFDYILPKILFRLNILESFRSEFWRYYGVPILDSKQQSRLTQDFHQLDSTQAVSFNLFFPFVQDQSALGILLKALGLEERRFDGFSFETQVDVVEGAYFDFHMQSESGGVYTVLRYAEDSFGSVETPTPGQQKKLRDIYTGRLKGRVPDMCLKPEVFFDHYDILRSVSMIDPGGKDHLVLIHPRANERLERKVGDVRFMLSGSLGAQVTFIHLEDLVDQILQSAVCPDARFKAHYSAFAEKYLIG